MNGKLIRAVFWGLVAAFIVVISLFMTARELLVGGHFLIISGAVLLLLGGALIYLTLKEKIAGTLKKLLLLTGTSAVGIPISAVLHNAIYGLFIYWFGADFWERIGLEDEPLFFVLAIFICPIGFLTGTIGSIIQFIKSGR